MNMTARGIRCVGTTVSGLLSCCVLISVTACAPDSDRPLSGPQAAARGEQVFEYNCGYCHGAEGRGPALTDIRSLPKAERRNRIINHPISGQIPQRLQAHEISDLNEFFEAE